MLRINRNTSALTVSLLFGLLSTTSCGFDDGYDKEDTGDDNVKVAFRMAFVNDNTRAVNDGWEDYNPTAPGDTYENAINADQLQIKVCDKDGNIIGDVQDVRVIKDQITGTWENAGDLLKQANKIMVFANCGTDNVTQDNISSLAFRVDQTKQYIPMWGVTTLTKDLVVGKQNNLGIIDLLRSLAKVKVKMADGMKARGYAWSQSVTMTNTTTDEESIMLYIPEYDNKTAAADRKASITLNLKCDGTDDGTYTLQFCNYVDGVADPSTLYNIQRNHYYEYTVNKDDRLNVTLKVQKWNKRKHSEIIM